MTWTNARRLDDQPRSYLGSPATVSYLRREASTAFMFISAQSLSGRIWRSRSRPSSVSV